VKKYLTLDGNVILNLFCFSSHLEQRENEYERIFPPNIITNYPAVRIVEQVMHPNTCVVQGNSGTNAVSIKYRAGDKHRRVNDRVK